MKILHFIKNIFILVVCFGATFVLFGFIQSRIDSPKEDIKVSVGSWVTTLAKIDIFIESPTLESVVENPIFVKGRAPGYWFFEASAPISVTNSEGLVVGESYIMATEDWMTTGYVGFEGNISFDESKVSESGFLVLEKDNPSGEVDFADLVKFKINFK
jgi:hypothetical protein